MGMGYVQPSGDIWLFEGVPLSPDHNDVFYITSNANAMEKLKNYPSKPYGQNSYTRTERGTLKIGDNANRLLTYNYLAWKNIRPDGINMWLFAFVTNIGYVNENCTEVSYVIDNYMTWFGFTQLAPCYVERETVEDDTLFSNLVPESLEVGNLVSQERQTYDMNGSDGHPMYYVIQASTNKYGESLGSYVNGLSCPLYYMKLPITASLNTFNEIIKWYHGENSEGDTHENTNTPENIINIQLMPAFLAETAVPESPTEQGRIAFDTIDIRRPTNIQGYNPKNNKLFSYPYCRLAVSNNSGQINEYKWELLGGGEDYGTFDIIGTVLGQPAILCYPEFYQGKRTDYDNAVMMTNFPPAPWINDTYKAYLAQNKASITTSIISTVLNGLSLGLVGTNQAVGQQAINNNASTAISQLSSEMGRNSGIISAITAPLNAGLNVATTLVKLNEAKFMPNSVPSLSQADMVMLVADRYQFDFYKVTITAKMAKVIDDYFSAYGYAVHQTKIPNINARPIWNYTKTIGCHFTYAPIPAQAKAEIINMFDSGVRFWKEPNQFGNLLLDNSING